MLTRFAILTALAVVSLATPIVRVDKLVRRTEIVPRRPQFDNGNIPVLNHSPTAPEIETPAGSSCALTTPTQICNLWACTPYDDCASWAAIAPLAAATPEPPTPEPPAPEPPSPEPPAYAPLAVNPIQCNNKADFHGHGDTRGDHVWMGASIACMSSTDLGPSSAPFTYRYKESFSQINYDYLISWEAGCQIEQKTMNTKSPLGQVGPECEYIMQDNYDKC